MKIGVDIGGTCTDLVLQYDDQLYLHKCASVPEDPVRGTLSALRSLAAVRNYTLRELLAGAELILHGTTVATNALATGRLARTALLTTEGHPDILVLREAGRMGLPLFDHRIRNPQPYIPRSRTFEVRERIGSSGEVVEPLDEAQLLEVVARLAHENVDAVAVCLLWSIVNPAHELHVGELLRAHLPGVRISLSHKVNPCLREYRRASSTAIDASLKPLVESYTERLRTSLEDAGFGGRLWLSTSQGTIADPERTSPIHLVRSGPALGPAAAAYYLRAESQPGVAILIDAGGTTFDVSVLREGAASIAREAWVGTPYLGHMTGLPAVDVRSTSAGGGSIAQVDSGGLLRIGPQSAGADPGPACYGLGGAQATVTDAAVVLGLQDLTRFTDCPRPAAVRLARDAINACVGAPLGLDAERAAEAVFEVFIEDTAGAIIDMTVERGIDPGGTTLFATGGMGGLVAAFLARRLACARVLVPPTASVNCAAGALLCDGAARFAVTRAVSSANFDVGVVAEVIASLRARCADFAEELAVSPDALRVELSVEARYASQSWEIVAPFEALDSIDASRLVECFHREHERLYHHRDANSPVEFLSWYAVATLPRKHAALQIAKREPSRVEAQSRTVQLPGRLSQGVEVIDGADLQILNKHRGPLIVETPLTTIVVDEPSTIRLTNHGSFVIELDA